MKNQWLLLGLGLAALAVAGAGWLIASQPYAFHGSTIEPPMRVADFTLTSHAGTPFRLSDQAGKIVVLFFGYTSCPDFCPTTLMEFKKVRARLVREAEHTQFIFITVDPERDTPDKLRAYLNSFDPAFIGLTGTEAGTYPGLAHVRCFPREKAGRVRAWLFDGSFDDRLRHRPTRQFALDVLVTARRRMIWRRTLTIW